jgi:hypothetical protein
MSEYLKGLAAEPDISRPPKCREGPTEIFRINGSLDRDGPDSHRPDNLSFNGFFGIATGGLYPTNKIFKVITKAGPFLQDSRCFF